MSVRGQACAVAVVVAVFHAVSIAQANVQPRWTDAELAGFADVILSGEVVDVRVGTDLAVNDIYTYVTVDVARVLKGAVAAPQVIVKQLGGRLDRRGLRVVGQAAFGVGETVLLFLEMRPRDGTLYTVAGWQGKRGLARGAARGVAVDTIAEVLARLPAVREKRAVVNTHPADAGGAVAQPYVLFEDPFRFNYPPVIDVQSGGQPGLAGGGFGEIFNALSRWNSAGSSFSFRAGSPNGPARCYNDELANGRVTVSFNDPCEEIADSGGTLAVGGAYYDTSRGAVVNGTFFYEATEGFVVNNDSPSAAPFLHNSHCFSDIQLHELGHVLGLDHSRDPTAIMYPTLSSACINGARGLGVDDVLGLRRIYPPSELTPPTTAPGNLSVVVNDTASITISFDAVSADVGVASSAATSYRLDFSTSPTGPVVFSTTSTATTVTMPIPTALLGTFYVSVAGVNGAGPGPTSPRVAFRIAGCMPPPTPTALVGSFVNSVAMATWGPSPGATSYIVQAGTVAGGADLANANIGNATGVSIGGLPAGFRAYVRVIAANACGFSAPTGDFLIQ